MSEAFTDRKRALDRIKADMGVIFGCSRCRDIGWVRQGREEVQCDRCGDWSREERSTHRKENYRRFAPIPELDAGAMTPSQRAIFLHYQSCDGAASTATILGWVESWGYEPKDDAEISQRAERERLKRAFLEGAA